MSEDWIFYPCTMGEQRAFIFFDHGIRDSINQTTLQFLLQIKLRFKHPRPDGLSSQGEFDALCALEDDVEEVVAKLGGMYVGRITVGGGRYLNIFTADRTEACKERLGEVGKRHGYELQVAHEPDAAKDGYWKELFPGPDDWQVIQDMSVLESLEKHGDDNSKERTIDHWAYFPNSMLQERFTRWLQDNGYVVQGSDLTEERGIRVRFTHSGTMKLAEITSHTIALRRQAEEVGGDYDGWETPVCK